ncbi:MAG: hypothetical protein FIB04_06910 [Gammaproteobacteria bacterium]|nr:hypothetical protein [Gammaproteobacteria bacterium]
MALYASPGRSAYRNESGVWLVEIRLHEVRQLFSHLDPAPFREKDLDPEAENYIDAAAREIGLRRPKKLRIHLPAGVADSSDARTLPDAVSNYFSYRASQTRNELHRLLARGLASLAIGLAFLFACLTLRRSLLSAGSHVVVAEGLLIIGWVALWRPVEIFLYDWWPIRRRQRHFEAIARMPVEVVAGPEPASRPAH